MRIGILQLPCSHTEHEVEEAVAHSGMQPMLFDWNSDSSEFSAMDGYVIVGGAAVESTAMTNLMAAGHPLIVELSKQAALGKPVLGMGRGANVLVDSGLVPGLENNKVGIALVSSQADREIAMTHSPTASLQAYMRLTMNYQRNAFTRFLTSKDIMQVSLSSQRISFVVPPALYAECEEQGQLLFQYCDQNGLMDSACRSIEAVAQSNVTPHIAAISNKAGNVLALIPYPDMTQCGESLFLSMRDYIENQRYRAVPPLHYYPRRPI